MCSILNSKLFVFGLTTVIFSSCLINGLTGEGNIITKKYTFTDFSSVELASSAKVEIIADDTTEVSLKEYQNLVDYWDLSVINKSLKIKTIPYTSFTRTSAEFTVKKSNGLNSVVLSGSGNIKISDGFPGLQKVTLSGSGKIDCEDSTHYNALQARISGSGNISFAGSANNLKAEIPGSGNLYFEDFSAKNADCSISGSGSIFVTVSDTLNANISGSGNIIYSGNPIVYVSGSGSGKVTHK